MHTSTIQLLSSILALVYAVNGIIHEHEILPTYMKFGFHVSSAEHDAESVSDNTFIMSLFWYDVMYQCSVIPSTLDAWYICDSRDATTSKCQGNNDFALQIEMTECTWPWCNDVHIDIIGIEQWDLDNNEILDEYDGYIENNGNWIGDYTDPVTEIPASHSRLYHFERIDGVQYTAIRDENHEINPLTAECITFNPTTSPTAHPSTARPTEYPTPQPTFELLQCPGGSHQIGSINADIHGCGLEECGDRYNKITIQECNLHCLTNIECKSYTWAPIGGDRNHLEENVCTIYNSQISDSEWSPNQIMCTPYGIQIECDEEITGHRNPYEIVRFEWTAHQDYSSVHLESCDSKHDTYLYVYDNTGEIARADDIHNHGEECDNIWAGDIAIPFPVTGPFGYGAHYTFGVGGYKDEDGEYTVKLICTPTPTVET